MEFHLQVSLNWKSVLLEIKFHTEISCIWHFAYGSTTALLLAKKICLNSEVCITWSWPRNRRKPALGARPRFRTWSLYGECIKSAFHMVPHRSEHFRIWAWFVLLFWRFICHFGRPREGVRIRKFGRSWTASIEFLPSRKVAATNVLQNQNLTCQLSTNHVRFFTRDPLMQNLSNIHTIPGVHTDWDSFSQSFSVSYSLLPIQE